MSGGSRAFMLIASTLITLFVIELGARYLYPSAASNQNKRLNDFYQKDEEGTPLFQPNVTGHVKSYDGVHDLKVEINSLGIRGDELDLQKATVAFLGDSITFNVWAGLDNTFEVIIEGRLRDQRIDGQEIQTANFGFSDTGIEEYYLRFKKLLLPLKPKLVVIGLYLNDSRPPQGFPDEQSRNPIEKLLAHWPFNQSTYLSIIHEDLKTRRLTNDAGLLKRFEWVYGFEEKGYLQDSKEWEKMLSAAYLDWGAAWSKESWKVIEEHLTKIKQLADKEDIQVWVMMFPVSPQIEVETLWPNMDLPQQTAKEICQKLGIPFLDLLPALRAKRSEHLFFDHCHLTETANLVVADTFLDFFKERGMGTPDKSS